MTWIFHTRRRRGSAMAMIIIISVVITGLVMTMAWAAGIQTQMTDDFTKLDQAFYTAEAGIHRVAWYCKNGEMGSITSPLTGSLGGYAYSASWTTISGSTIRITSTGSLGNVSYTMYETVAPPAASAPVLALGDNFNNNDRTIYGNVVTGGSYSNTGTGTLNGNLTYYAGATNTSSVTGTITHATGSFPSVNMTTLGSTLIAAAGKTYTGTQTNVTFDFTSVPGNPKVIYVNGPVVNPTFIGSGTLYSSGAVSGLAAFGTSSNPVNIVASAAITNTNSSLTCYGSIYTGGAWAYGTMNITGIAYVSGTVSSSNSGSLTMTLTAAPWFDPRTSGGGGGSTTTFTSFMGPLP